MRVLLPLGIHIKFGNGNFLLWIVPEITSPKSLFYICSPRNGQQELDHPGHSSALPEMPGKGHNWLQKQISHRINPSGYCPLQAAAA